MKFLARLLNGALLLLVAAVLFSANYSGFPSLTIHVLFFLNVLVALAGLYVSLSSSSLGLLDLTYWGFMTGLVILPGMLHVALNEFRWPVVHTANDVEFVLVLILVGNLFYILGSLVGRYTRLRMAIDTNRSIRPNPNLLRFRIFLVIPALIILLAFGPSVFFSGRSNITVTFSAAGGYAGRIFMVSRSFLVVASVISAALWRNALSVKLPLPLFHQIVSVGTVVLTIVFINPLSAPRFWTLSLFVAIAVVLYRKIDVASKSIMFPIAVLSFVTFMSLIKSLGVSDVALTERKFTVSNPFDKDAVSQYLATADFDNFQTTMNPVIYSRENGIRWGRNILGILLFWVPNDLWHGKPEDTGMVAADSFGYKFTNLSVPIVAELYNAFGAFGVCGGLFFLGNMFARADRLYLAGSDRLALIGLRDLTYCIFGGFLFINLRGSMLGGMPQYGFAIAVPFLLLYVRPFRRFLGF